jgi:hypothetical protein
VDGSYRRSTAYIDAPFPPQVLPPRPCRSRSLISPPAVLTNIQHFASAVPHLRAADAVFACDLSAGALSLSATSGLDSYIPRSRPTPIKSHAGSIILLRLRRPTQKTLVCCAATAEPQSPRHRRVAEQARDNQRSSRPLPGPPTFDPWHTGHRHVKVALAAARRMVESGLEHTL